jgi:uncharacterized protein (DUF58 family)
MIQPDFLDELERLRSVLERESSALRQGEQRSPRVGEGLTFSDFRRYSPGDDTRLIDWKLYARTDEFFIKQFEEERSLTVHVLLDASGSMDFGVDAANKFEYAAKIGLGFAALTAANHNEFSVSVFRDEVERLDAGRSNRGEVIALIDRLNEMEVSGESDIEAALASFADRIRNRSLVLVLSDCLEDPEAVESGVAALSGAGADVLVVRVMAPGERDPDVVGETLFADPESEATKRSYFSGPLASEYRSRLEGHVGAISERVTTMGADHELLDTADDFFESFASVWLE